MTPPVNLRHLLDQHLLVFPARQTDLARLATFLQHEAAPIDRRTAAGQVVASGVVTDGAHVLLIHHRSLQRWLQPGGHIDSGESPWEAAQREVLEETGVVGVLDPWHADSGTPLDIDTHVIPGNPRKGEAEHLHFDFRYLIRVERISVGVAQLAEVTELAWVPWGEAVVRVDSLGRCWAHARRLGLLA